MKKVGRWVLRYRALLLVVVGFLSVLAALGLPRLRVESDLVKWLNPKDPVVQRFRRIGREYGGTQMVMVVLETDRLFSPEGLRLVRDLTETYRSLPGVSGVTSLTRILDIRKTEEGLEVTRLVDPWHLPTQPQELERLRAYVLSRDLYRGRIVSDDGRRTLILVRLQEQADKPALARRLRDTTQVLVAASGLPVQVYLGGMPVEMVEASELVMADLRRLMPVAALVVLLVLFLGFRSLRGVILPLGVVALATLWVMGAMGWLQVPLSIVSNVIPVILIAVGTAYGIHMLAHYREALNQGLPVARALEVALEGAGVPILLAGLTTLAGFLSFLGAYLVPINHFGLFTALGVALAMGLSLTLLPAILSYLPPMKGVRSLEPGAQGLDRWLRPLENWALRHPRLVLLGSLGVLVFAGLGLTRISTSVNLMEYFPENSNIRRASEVLRTSFGGDIPVQLLVTGSLRNPFVLQEMLRLEKYLRTVPGVHAPQSLADLIAQMNETLNGRYTIPETPEAVANLRFLLEGEEILEQLVRTEDDAEGLIQATFAGASTNEILAAHDRIEQYLHTKLARRLVPLEAAPDMPEPLRRALCRRTAELLYWDLSYHAGHPVAFPWSLADSLESWQVQPVALQGPELRALEQRLQAYFSEEADVDLAPGQATHLARQLARLAQSGTVDTLALQKILRQGLLASLLRKDPELLTYLREEVVSLLAEALKDARVDRWLRRILAALPDSLARNPELQRDLRGDLWTLVQQRVALPLELVQGAGLAPDTVIPLRVEPAGMLPVEARIHRNILRGQVRSFLLAFVIVALLVALQLRSPFAGFLATFPIVLVVALNFGIMGFVGVPLDSATMLIASIAIGIGIDYIIHMISRYHREIQRHPNPRETLAVALKTTGRAVLLNAFTVGLGFLVLVFASLTPLRRLGWMVALTMGTSAFAALTFLPALIQVAHRVFRPAAPKRR